MPIAPAERVSLTGGGVRCVAYPHRGRPMLPEHQVESCAAYAAQFHVWCGARDGAVEVRDAREVAMGLEHTARADTTPTSALDVVYRMAYPQSFARTMAAVRAATKLTDEEGEWQVWVGFSDGVVRVFTERRPFRLLGAIGFPTNKAACNSLAAPAPSVAQCARFVVGAFGDDHVLVFDAIDRTIHRKLLGHTAAVTSVAFIGNSVTLFASAGDDGRLCLWDCLDGGDAPVSASECDHAITSVLSAPLSAEQAAQIIHSKRGQKKLPDHPYLRHVAPDDWAVVWTANHNGDVDAFMLPSTLPEAALPAIVNEADEVVGAIASAADHEAAMLAIDELIAGRGIFHAHKKSAVLSLTHGPPTPDGAPTILGSSAGTAKTFRYSAVTFAALPALSPAAGVADGPQVGLGAGAYPPCAVSGATVVDSWSLDAGGAMTPVRLERAGAATSRRAPQELAADRLRAVERAAVRTFQALDAHQIHLDAIRNPKEDRDIIEAAVESAQLTRERTHLTHGIVSIAGRSNDLALIGRTFRTWLVFGGHRRHVKKRREALALLFGNHAAVRRDTMTRWAHGANVMKVRRVKREAAERLSRIHDRHVATAALRKWIEWRAQRDVGHRIAALIGSTSIALRRDAFAKLRAFRRYSQQQKANNRMLDVLKRQMADGLRSAFFDKWRDFLKSVAIERTIRRTTESCVAALCSGSERANRVVYFNRWMRFPAVARANKARLNAASFLVGSSTALLRAKSFTRWRDYARGHAIRRVSGGAGLQRLTETGLRRAYFNKWRSSVTMRKATTARTASAEGATWFVASRNTNAMRDLYFGKWRKFAAECAMRRRSERVLEAFIRQTRLGRVLVAYRTWVHWSAEQQSHKRRRRTAGLLARSSTEGLRRQYFSAWLQYPRRRRDERRRDNVIGTLGRNSSSYLRALYFRRWMGAVQLAGHFKEVSQFMSNSGASRLLRLRDVYYGKWFHFACVRAIERRSVAARRATDLQEALDEKRGEIEGATDGIETGRGDMINTQADIEQLQAQRLALEREIAVMQDDRAAVERRIEVKTQRVEDTTTKVLQYVYTVKSSRERPNVIAIASGWKQSWLAVDARLRHLIKRNGDGHMLPFEELHASLEAMRTEALSLRSRISCDVVDHLAIKKEPPMGSPAIASPARTARSQLTVSTPRRRASPASSRQPSPMRPGPVGASSTRPRSASSSVASSAARSRAT